MLQMIKFGNGCYELLARRLRGQVSIQAWSVCLHEEWLHSFHR